MVGKFIAEKVQRVEGMVGGHEGWGLPEICSFYPLWA